MNECLKTQDQINEATEWLKSHDFITHPISCKDWELMSALTRIGSGDVLDMGADGSFILHNVVKQNLVGRKVGIDLAEVTGDNRAEGAEYYVGDLMLTEFKNESFDFITSCSVLEHNVDLKAFSKEVSRLLKPGGELIVSFDYWPTKINTAEMLLYGLPWHILSRQDAVELIEECESRGLELTGNVDWETKDAVINPQYCSPFPGISYTFCILNFYKK